MFASAEGRQTTVQLLVDAGADKDARDKVNQIERESLAVLG